MLRRMLFNLWYGLRRPPWDSGITPPELARFIQESPAGRALDLGCGTGTNVIELARHGWQATGIDFASVAIWRARRKAKRAGVQVEFLEGDVTRLDFLKGDYDLILDIGCFHSIPGGQRPAYVGQVKRLLDHSGTFLIYLFYRGPRQSGAGITEAELEIFSPELQLVQREDGFNRGDESRSSSWLWYKRSDRSARLT